MNTLRMLRKSGPATISFPEPTCLLVSNKTRVLVLTKRDVGFGNEIGPARALDPCHRPEGSWALGSRMVF